MTSKLRKNFVCYGYIGLSIKGSGLLYPIFKAERLNIPYVQEIDRDFKISSFIPFFDTDNFRFYPALSERSCSIGDASIYAFCDENQQLVEIDSTAAIQHPAIENQELPILTRLQLARLAKAALSTRWQLHSEFVQEFIPSAPVRKAVTTAGMKIDQEESAFWDGLTGAQASEANEPIGNDVFRSFDNEELIRWLFDHPHSAIWVDGLARFMRRVVFDSRIFDLLVKLCAADDFSFATASAKERFILLRGMELTQYTEDSKSVDDFMDSMIDHAVSGDILKLAIGDGLPIVLDFIDKLDSSYLLSTAPADIYLDELERNDISRELANALLDRVVDSPVLFERYTTQGDNDATRLDKLKSILRHFGRIALLVDAKRRNEVLRLSPARLSARLAR